MKESACIQTPLGFLRIDCFDDFVTGINFVEAGDLSENPANPTLNRAIVELRAYFEGTRANFTFLYQQQGTPFQQEVWRQLVLIPFGQTITYKELALRLGDEKKVRAAAGANGKNSLSIVVPCHRVIGSGGHLVGYAGGLERKDWLLKHEAGMCGKPMQGALF
jgi:methylated-DNA-[protein]-cysteine S-methyltransferase